jgi:hypothetical protein
VGDHDTLQPSALRLSELPARGVTVHKFANELHDELILDFVFGVSQNFSVDGHRHLLTDVFVDSLVV